MSNELFGFNFKKEVTKKEKETARKITGTSLRECDEWGYVIGEGSIAHKELFKAGVLDLWFDRVSIDAVTLKLIK